MQARFQNNSDSFLPPKASIKVQRQHTANKNLPINMKASLSEKADKEKKWCFWIVILKKMSKNILYRRWTNHLLLVEITSHEESEVTDNDKPVFTVSMAVFDRHWVIKSYYSHLPSWIFRISNLVPIMMDR